MRSATASGTHAVTQHQLHPRARLLEQRLLSKLYNLLDTGSCTY